MIQCSFDFYAKKLVSLLVSLWLKTEMKVILIKLFLSLSLPPVFEFTATAQTAMGSSFLVLSPNIIKASLPGHCPLPFGQWPLRGKT